MIYVYPADTHGCGYYRLIWPAEVLQAHGHDVRVVMPKERDAYLQGGLDRDGNLVQVQVPDDAELIVLQRISHRRMVDAVTLIRQSGVPVIIDIDDDLSVIHRDNPAWVSYAPNMPPYDHSWKNTVAACKNATLVTVSTPELLKHYTSGDNGVVVPNCVPRRYLEVSHIDSNSVGWGGSIRSHPDDLSVIGHAAARLERDGHMFHVVGPSEYDPIVRSTLNVHNVRSTGVMNLHTAWPEGLAGLGIGLAPLSDTRFNRSKSWLKLLEMAAVGVPSIASPRIEYRKLNQLGVGLLASSPGDWYGKIRRLIDDKDLRDELSERGREIASRFTIEENYRNWLDAWQLAIEREQRQPITGVVHPLGRAFAAAVQTNGQRELQAERATQRPTRSPKRVRKLDRPRRAHRRRS